MLTQELAQCSALRHLVISQTVKGNPPLLTRAFSLLHLLSSPSSSPSSASDANPGAGPVLRPAPSGHLPNRQGQPAPAGASLLLPAPPHLPRPGQPQDRNPRRVRAPAAGGDGWDAEGGSAVVCGGGGGVCGPACDGGGGGGGSGEVQAAEGSGGCDCCVSGLHARDEQGLLIGQMMVNKVGCKEGEETGLGRDVMPMYARGGGPLMPVPHAPRCARCSSSSARLACFSLPLSPQWATNETLEEVGRSCPSLRSLLIRCNADITDAGLVALAALNPNLTHLNVFALAHSLTYISLVSAARHWTSLETLILPFCERDDRADLPDLVKVLSSSCPKLKVFSIGLCAHRYFEALLELLGSCSSLEYVYLYESCQEGHEFTMADLRKAAAKEKRKPLICYAAGSAEGI
ncbi:unnamed protein product [Closterium sp. NIES-54]